MKWVHAGSEIATRGWAEASARLTSLADRADLLVTGQVYQEVAANVAEYTTFRWPHWITSHCGSTAN